MHFASFMTTGVHTKQAGENKTSPESNPPQSAFRFRRTRPTSLHSHHNASDVPAGPASATPTSITGNLHVCAAVNEDSPRHSARDRLTAAPRAPYSAHSPSSAENGTVFDSSKERGEPARFPLNRVIPCWTEALQLMKVGGEAVITCPAESAYGERGAGDKIRPGAALRFDVALLAIE